MRRLHHVMSQHIYCPEWPGEHLGTTSFSRLRDVSENGSSLFQQLKYQRRPQDRSDFITAAAELQLLPHEFAFSSIPNPPLAADSSSSSLHAI
ncbi:hypothetical protein CEXT_609631 [Caerostris extrusa]|uniref:Uncharacterized protein n=1 Tax=Caerostris extrusa TaxID=172846 RepID=A0AAV4R006_CAEEX|nr:hypothetical protein CEXT_609631 [Caerostris extrusa]